MIQEERRHFPSSCFMEVVIIAMWTISVHRNNIIFNAGTISF
uniref:Uncharacterized protein n=1 Tax=Arundo donax TaxID=35708 RepID=A0A0A8ZBA7_ARUDO